MSVVGSLGMFEASIKIKPRTEVDDYFKTPEDRVTVSNHNTEVTISVKGDQLWIDVSTAKTGKSLFVDADGIINIQAPIRFSPATTNKSGVSHE